ncbi:MAG: DUF3526 domain-containing protein [Acidobacteriota bacterium]|nr:DUF3526 domain-containing protein [Acidobacteriota bacterium]
MLTQIVKHEWRNLNADRTLWWIILILAVAISYGVYNGTSWVAFLEGTIEVALQEEHDRLAKAQHTVANGLDPERASRSPYSARYIGRRMGLRYAYLPPGPLASLSVGQSDLYPSYFLVNTQATQRQKRHSELENPNHLLESRFDLAFVTVYLFPLLILALTYNLISSEREQGTLAMVLSQPVSLRKFVVGKVGFRALMALTLVIGFSILAFLLNGVNLFGMGTTLKLLLWISIVIVYSAFWFGLALAVNTIGRSSATNAIILTSLWLVFVVLVPSVVNLLVKTLHPVPSRVEYIVAMRDASMNARAEEAQLLSIFYEDHPELLSEDEQSHTENFDTLQWAAEMKVEESMQPVLNRFNKQLAKQQTQVNRLRFLSPAIVTQEALNEIAGTGPTRFRHFMSIVDAFHEEWRTYFVPKIFALHEMTGPDFDEIPDYTYLEDPEDRIANRILVALVGMIIPTLGVFIVGFSRIRHYPLNG